MHTVSTDECIYSNIFEYAFLSLAFLSAADFFTAASSFLIPASEGASLPASSNYAAPYYHAIAANDREHHAIHRFACSCATISFVHSSLLMYWISRMLSAREESYRM